MVCRLCGAEALAALPLPLRLPLLRRRYCSSACSAARRLLALSEEVVEEGRRGRALLLLRREMGGLAVVDVAVWAREMPFSSTESISGTVERRSGVRDRAGRVCPGDGMRLDCWRCCCWAC